MGFLEHPVKQAPPPPSQEKYKIVEKLSGQLKFKVTDLGPRLHKVTGQFFNWPKRVVLSYLSMQVPFCSLFQVLFHSSLLGQKKL